MVDVLANTASVSTSVSKIEKDIEGFGSTATKALGMVGVAFGAAEVISYGKAIVENAGHIQDMSDKLGVSTTAVQKWTNAAELGGGTIEDVAKSANKLNINLAGGSNSTKEALAAAGLSFADIRKMNPEQAFEAVATAVAGIEDPMKRAQVATALMGKGALELLPTLGQIKNQSDAGIISPENVKALDDLGDAFTTAMQKGKALGAWFAGGLVRDVQSGQSWVEKTYLKITLGSEGANEAMRQQAAMAAATAKQHEDAEKKKQEALAKSEAEFEKTTAATKKKEEADKKAAAAAQQHTDVVKKLADAYSGKTDIDEAKLAIEGLTKAHIDVAHVSQLSEDQQKAVNKTMAEAIEVYKRHGQVAPQAMRDLYIATIPIPPAVYGITGAMNQFGETVKMTIPEIDTFNMKIVEGIPGGVHFGTVMAMPEIPKALATNKELISDLTKNLTQMGTVAGSTFNGIAQGFATALTAGETFGSGLKGLKGGLKDMKTDGLAGFLEMSSGIMGMASAAIQVGSIVKGVWDKIFGAAGRDLVKDFAATFQGGFDGPNGLHAHLLAGGAEGEALWVKLTQGVGRNNPQQAKSVIAEVEAFLDGLKTKQKEVGDAAEEATQAQIDGYTKVKRTLQEGIDVPVRYKSEGAELPDGEVPGFASGVTNFRGGLAVVGENGPELVRLPRGSDVIPNGGSLATPGGTVINISVERGLGGPAADAELGELIGRKLERLLASQGYRR